MVRSLVVSLAPAGEIWQAKEKHQPIPTLRFYLGLKGDDGNYRLTLLGGKMRPGEVINESALREITEEGSFTPLGLPRQANLGSWEYKIPLQTKNNLPPRRATLTYSPVMPINILEAHIGDAKVKQLVTLSYKQLKEAIETGQVTLTINGQKQQVPIEEHLAIGQSAIFSSPEDENKQSESLTEGLSWMEHIDSSLSKKINSLVEASATFEEFKQKYDRLLSHFMKKGLQAALKFKNKAAKDNEARETADLLPDILTILNQGGLGKEVLYYLPQLAKASNPFEWPGLEESPERVVAFIEFFKKILNRFLEDNNFQSPRQLNEFLLSEQLILQEKNRVINHLDNLIRRRLEAKYGLTGGQIAEGLRMAKSFFSSFSINLKQADPNMRQIYQDFAFLNEIKNANLGHLLLLFLGFDTKNNPESIWPQLKFEAGRQLLVFLKTIGGLDYYHRHVEAITKENRFQLALNAFFGSVVGDLTIPVGDEKMITHLRLWGDKKIIVDERPLPKTPDSFIRKAFEEPYEEIVDFFSVSIIFPDPAKEAKDFIDRLNQAPEVILQFVKFLKQQYPDISVEWDGKIRSYGSNDFRQMFEANDVVNVQAKGKRQGSHGNRLVRCKAIIKMGNEILELIVYPFINLPDHELFMAWQEKIQDDRDYAIRRSLAGSKGIPPIYSLFYPSEIYPQHYHQKINSRYHRD